jgi:hypothetical protein
MTQRFPLVWPQGWGRTSSYNRQNGKFGTQERQHSRDGNNSWMSKKDITMPEAITRVFEELRRIGVDDPMNDAVISTNLRLNMAGYPRADQGEPLDPGVAVYWQTKKEPMRVIAVDRYNRVRDNIAAVAATLDAMRAIERHGGATVLERAFTGFDALPAPGQHAARTCWQVLGLEPNAIMRNAPQVRIDAVKARWRDLAAKAHPDAGGSTSAMAEINVARDEALRIVAGSSI